MSKPPNIGEPKKNASVTIEPRTIPTRINRLFISRMFFARIKSNCSHGIDLEECFKAKIASLVHG